MRNVLQVAVLAATILVPSAAGATSIPIASTDGIWTGQSGGDPGPTFRALDNTTTPRTIRWGIEKDGDAVTWPGSGYDYKPATLSAQDVGTPFVLGEFVHQNFEVYPGSAPTEVYLNFQLAIGGPFNTTITKGLTFTHVETPNGPATGSDPCPYGGDNNQGVNENGCADSVTLSTLIDAAFSDPQGNTYFFSLLGFSPNGLGNNQLLTKEAVANGSNLYGVITEAPINPVPEPGSMMLLGTGLLAVATRFRRKRQ